jgi:hypothetical protein
LFREGFLYLFHYLWFLIMGRSRGTFYRDTR